MLFGDYFASAIFVREANDVIAELGQAFHGATGFVVHGLMQPPFWIAVAGFITATWIWLFNPGIADKAATALKPVHTVLWNKYWIDNLYQAVFARAGIAFGRGLWRVGDAGLIDGAIVNGSARLVDRVSARVRRLQSGYLYHYAFAMILGLILLLAGLWWVVVRAA
jgi:NADH-quinone oxidoreductase subunit L